MATRYNSQIIKDGLQLCLDSANPKSYPGSGTTWYDLSEYGRNATLSSTPTLSNGKLQLSTSVYGTFSSVSLSGIPFTVMAWVYKNDTNDFSIIGGGAGGGNANSHYIIRSSRVYFGNYGCDIQGSTNINANTWYHMTYLMDSSQYQSVFLNGVLDGGPTYTCGYYGSYVNTVGTSCCGGAGTALVDHLLIYNRALTTGEIIRNYNSSKSRFKL